MTSFKLVVLSFLITSISTGLLCLAYEYPLIATSSPYSLFDFTMFGLLLAVMSYSLVYIVLPVLSHLKNDLQFTHSDKAFYSIYTLLCLHFFILVGGYLESGMYIREGADFLYYYKGAGNSLIYVLTGTVTSLIIAALYATKHSVPEYETKD
ncbi:hypothetical protein QNI16_11470 [Cytophagaceae bacterium YF14B1]|uniref:Uncharacterized protein n=1 Tax=Xanthocytophaga flava TaxID=3048013 RepID=A0AAE3QQ07_9BACT|nr:hypothetical protein [Xanthocytophaga flavus]MDJ1481105.1 hypothetical protein [Xanthocytophaga flavus]